MHLTKLNKLRGFSTLVKYFTDRSKAVHSFYFCLVFVVLSCASVFCCLVVTRWDRADLSALVCDV